MSVDRSKEHLLLRSGWGAVVEVRFSRNELRHDGFLHLISERLAGRTELLSINEDTLLIDFQMEDDGEGSRRRVQEFAEGVSQLLGKQARRVEVRFNYLDPDLVERVLADERPNLRIL